MDKTHKSKLQDIHQETFEELYVADTIVQMTKMSCQEREFAGQYYGISQENSFQLSAERNSYINMLNVLSEKLSNIMDLNLSLEKEIMLNQLHQNSNNGC